MKTPFGIFTLISFLLTISACSTTQGKIVEGKYSSARGWFSVPIPKATNWARIPFSIQDASMMNQPGVSDCDLVKFWVKDFGEVLIASVCHIPQALLPKMIQEDSRTVLSTLADKALHDWRDGLPNSLPLEPTALEDTYFNTSHGEAILRLYMAEKGSLLVQDSGRGLGAERFDAYIAVILVKQKNHYLYAIAENDAGMSLPYEFSFRTPGKDRKESLKEYVQSFFESMRVNR